MLPVVSAAFLTPVLILYHGHGTDQTFPRCHRLKRECIPSVTVRRRNGRRTQVSRAAALEEKLEDIVTLLRNQTTATPNVPTANDDRTPTAGDTVTEARPITPTSSDHSVATHVEAPQTPPVVFPPSKAHCKTGVQGLLVRGTLLGGVFGKHSPPPADREPDDDRFPSCPYIPSPLEAEENFETFRRNMLPFLPFMYMPPALTVHQLQEYYPFLWFNIMTITCMNVDRQLVMAEAATQFLAQKTIVESEKSLDLLLGLLTSIAW